MPRFSRLISLLAATLILSACASGPIKKEAEYPSRARGSDDIIYNDAPRPTIFEDNKTLGDKLFGSSDKEDKGTGTAGIGVNSFLWRASLDTLSFMPIASADPFGGVILTDWYENPDHPGERYKINIYILDKQLRADGIRCAVFKQQKQKDGWHDAKVADEMSTNIENAILTRARELRVAQMGTGKN